MSSLSERPPKQQFGRDNNLIEEDTALHILVLQVSRSSRKQPNRAGLGAMGVRGLGMLAASARA